MGKAPEIYMGKRKVFEENFISPHDYSHRSEALHKLKAIREGHPSSYGWVEIDFTLHQLPNGNWHLEVHHAKYE